MWLIVCCLFGSWILNYLVICFPGFRRYTHTCPKCRTIIAQTEPKHTTCQFVTIMLTSIGVIGLVLLIGILYYLNNPGQLRRRAIGLSNSKL